MREREGSTMEVEYEVIAGDGLGFLLTTRVVLAVGARTSHGTFVRAARVSIATWRGDG